MNNVLKKGITITKVLIWNKVENNEGYIVSECELSFNDGTQLHYECNCVEELESQNIGIYELLEDGSYIQVEDWE